MPPSSRERSESETLDRAFAAFRARFGDSRGARAFFAPGRANLLGAHVDYNGGVVLPAAVDRGTYALARPRGDGTLRLASLDREPEVEVRADALEPDPSHAWANYPKGVFRYLAPGGNLRGGADLLFATNLPIGAGLSSSASIELAAALALSALSGNGLPMRDLVEAALRAEREFVGVPCGIMDPYASGYGRAGHLLRLDCKTREFDYLPFDETRALLVVADTGVRRTLANSEFERRVAECRSALAKLSSRNPAVTCLRDATEPDLDQAADLLTPEEARRARHVVDEVARVAEAGRCLESGDYAAFGKLLDASHRSSRDLYEVSSRELDALAEGARAVEGTYGARLTGAGFGGCVLVLVAPDALDALREEVTRTYGEAVGLDPAFHVFAPAGGPREIPA